jgi:hypothetical protein
LFLQKRQRLFSSPHWWFEQESKRPLKPLQLSDWSRAEMPYIAHLLSGPLHWWGACDIALSPDGRLLAFRLTPLAGWLLNAQTVETSIDELSPISAMTLLRVISSDEILVPCSMIAWPTIEILETYTQAAGVQQDQLRYHLTPAALSNALGRGLHPSRLVELLRSLPAATNEEGPLAGLLKQLEQWLASYGRVRIYTGVKLLETSDAAVMRELSATTSVDASVVQSIHSNLLVLKKAAFESVIDELKRRGQPPLLHDEDFYGPE